MLRVAGRISSTSRNRFCKGINSYRPASLSNKSGLQYNLPRYLTETRSFINSLDCKNEHKSSQSQASASLIAFLVAGVGIVSYSAFKRDDDKKPELRVTLGADEDKINRVDNSGANLNYDDYNDVILNDRGVEMRPGWQNAPIKEVVLATIDSQILDPDADVLLDIYSPNCTQCQSFALVWEALQTSLADVPTIRVCKMDGINNYRRGFLSEEEESSFPNIKIYPAGNEKTTAMFKAGKEIEELIEFRRMRNEAKAAGKRPPPSLLDRREVTPVGLAWSMRWRSSELSGEALIDWIHDNVKHKFDKDATKEKFRKLRPETAKKLTVSRRANETPDERVASLAPCATEWSSTMDEIALSNIGMGLPEAVPNAFKKFRECTTQNDKQSRKFWTAVRTQADFVFQILPSEDLDSTNLEVKEKQK